MLKLHFLSDNKTDKPDFLAEHGLSILIETGEKKLLFDAGASDIFFKNAVRMGRDVTQVDAVIISHGHYDHTEGIPLFCRVNKKAPIYIHKDSFQKAYFFENGKLDEEHCGIRWTKDQYDDMKERMIFTEGVFPLSENMMISGTIPDIEGCSQTERFYVKGENGSLDADPMNHEQFLAIRDYDRRGNSKGIYLFSGCSHKGIEPCLSYAKYLFPGEKITGLIAGMHLFQADRETRIAMAERLEAEGLDVLIPVHCTGMQATCDMKRMLGKRCILAGAGDTVVL